MAYGLLLLRLVVGVTLAGHGAQKLFGAFGGGGVRGTASAFASLGYRAPVALGLAVGLAEVGGGVLLALGLLTPLAALAILVVQLNAIAAVHWPRGFWNADGGYEFNLLICAVAVALAASGAGRLSLDGAVGWEHEISGVWWGVAVLICGAILSSASLWFGRPRGAGEPAAGSDEHSLHRAA